MDYAKQKAELKETQRDLEQQKEHYDQEFKSVKENVKELYNSRNETQIALTDLTTTVKMLVQNMDKQFNSLEKKLDEINDKVNRGSN